MRTLCDNEIESILDMIKSVIRGKYYKRCRRLGWKNSDIVDWAESVSGLGVALGLHNISKWDPNRGNISCWLYLCANSTARGEIRKLQAYKRQGNLFTEPLTEEDHETYDPFESLLDRDELREALQDLTPIQREVIVLYEYVGMKVSEMAPILGCPPKTIYTHLDRARKKASLFRPRTNSSTESKTTPRASEIPSPPMEVTNQHTVRPPPSKNDSNTLDHRKSPTRRPK